MRDFRSAVDHSFRVRCEFLIRKSLIDINIILHHGSSLGVILVMHSTTFEIWQAFYDHVHHPSISHDIKKIQLFNHLDILLYFQKVLQLFDLFFLQFSAMDRNFVSGYSLLDEYFDLVHL